MTDTYIETLEQALQTMMEILTKLIKRVETLESEINDYRKFRRGDTINDANNDANDKNNDKND